jgi:hypothetical protein
MRAMEAGLRRLLQVLQNFGQVGSLFNRGLSLHSIQFCASSGAHAPRAAQHLAFFILISYLARLLLQGRRPVSVATWRRDKSDGKHGSKRNSSNRPQSANTHRLYAPSCDCVRRIGQSLGAGCRLPSSGLGLDGCLQEFIGDGARHGAREE